MRKLLLLSSTAFLLIGCDATYLQSKQRIVDFLTTDGGISLYTFDHDGLNESTCDTECLKKWTKYLGTASKSSDLTTIPLTNQLLYRKHALYTFNRDAEIDDIKGDNFNTTWHLVYGGNTIEDTQINYNATSSMKQTYLTDKNGRALYTFDKDSYGESHCYAGCENIWPVYYAPVLLSVPSSLNKSDFATIQRDKSKVLSGKYSQTTYKGKPLYYFHKDFNQTNTTKGDWVAGVWHLVEIDAHKSSQQAKPLSALPKKVSDANLSYTAKIGRKLFYNPKKGSCFKCHGNMGQSKPPSILGLPIDNVIARFGNQQTIKERLLDMKNNPNSGRDPSMIKGAKALSDEEIENVSAFIATLKD